MNHQPRVRACFYLSAKDWNLIVDLAKMQGCNPETWLAETVECKLSEDRKDLKAEQ